MTKKQAPEIKQILSSTTAWNGAPLPPLGAGQTEMRVLNFKMTPGSKTTIHFHPINGAGYIISGELTMFSTNDPHGSFEDKNKVKTITLKAGESWAETVNAWHYGENKGDTDVEFVLIFAAQAGVPSTLSLNTVEQSV